MTHVAMVASPFGRRDGILRHATDLARLLAERGHQVVLYGMTGTAEDVAWVQERSGPAVRIRAIAAPARATGKLTHYLAYERDVAQALMRDHTAHPFDVIHAHAGYSVVARRIAKAGGPSVISTVHGVEADRYRARFVRTLRGKDKPGVGRAAGSALLAPLTAVLGRPLYAEATALVVTCKFVEDAVRRSYRLTQPAEHVPHAIDPAPFLGTPPPEPSTAGVEILYAGRLFHDKGLSGLIDAFAQLPLDARLRLVGKGYMRQRLEDRARRAGVAARVTFADSFVSEDEWPSMFARSPILVMPSTYEPGISTALLEAMASARVVVASDFGGLGEVVQPGQGSIYAADSVPALRDALAQAMASPERWSAWGLAARARVMQDYSWPRLVERIEKVYASYA